MTTLELLEKQDFMEQLRQVKADKEQVDRDFLEINKSLAEMRAKLAVAQERFLAIPPGSIVKRESNRWR